MLFLDIARDGIFRVSEPEAARISRESSLGHYTRGLLQSVCSLSFLQLAEPVRWLITENQG